MRNRKPEQQAELVDELASRRLEVARASDRHDRRAHLEVVEDPSSLVWEPPAQQEPGAPPTTSQVLNVQRQQSDQLPTEIEAALVSVLTRRLADGEGHHTGAIRREQAIAAIIMDLDPLAAYWLARRLDADRDSDPIVAAFRRLIPQRRERLRVVLDQRRRMFAALGGRASSSRV